MSHRHGLVAGFAHLIPRLSRSSISARLASNQVRGNDVAKKSAGLILYREVAGRREVLLCHPAGPFWARKDKGAWSVPKGEFEDGEDPLSAARREFKEETGFSPASEFVRPLEPVRQAGGKLVYAWAMKFDLEPSGLKSNTFSSSGHRNQVATRSSPRLID